MLSPDENVWVPTPPGWIEVVGLGEDEVRAHWAEMVEPVRSVLGDDAVTTLYELLAAARTQSTGTGAVSAGLVVTFTAEGATTLWSAATSLHHVDSPDLSPAGLLERAAGTGVVGDVERAEDLTTVDGRPGVQVLLTGTATTEDDDGGGTDEAGGTGDGPGGSRARYACALVGVQPAGRPHDLVLTTVSSQDPAELEQLAALAQGVAAGVYVGERPPGLDRAAGVLGGRAR